MTSADATRADPAHVEAAIFDMDGVITDTRRAHEAAWKRLFDAYREERASRGDDAYAPFTTQDYREHLDGKPRYDGVRDFLASRRIDLPWGDPEDPPEAETICGLGNRKNRHFRDWLAENRVGTWDDALDLIDALRSRGARTAVISASRNCKAVLENAGVADRFDARVDGEEMAEHDLPGKPDPAIFLRAAEKLGAAASRAMVVEDALAGVQAGAAGGFGLVVGVNRGPEDQAQALKERGADRVVADLRDLLGKEPPQDLASAPAAEARSEDLRRRVAAGPLAVFLDYDGTLTPIVADYTQAKLDEGMREALHGLSRVCRTAIISGRDLQDVRSLVGIDSLYYAGSHGFDMAGPGGWRKEAERAKDFLPDLDGAEDTLRARARDVEGVKVERKRFSIAVHFRQAAPDAGEQVERIVDETLSDRDRLRKKHGRKVFEVQPRIEWDKGRAVLTLLDELGFAGPEGEALYLGDDVTDEDAFRALEDAGRGFGIVVRGAEDRQTWARYALEDVEAVERFLRRLAEWKEGEPA